MSIRVLSDEDYNKLCTWGMTACLPLLPGETMKNLIERMRQSNIACVKAWYGDPATDQIGPWEFNPDSCDLLEILEIIGAYDYNIDVECDGLAIARRFLDYIREGPTRCRKVRPLPRSPSPKDETGRAKPPDASAQWNGSR